MKFKNFKADKSTQSSPVYKGFRFYGFYNKFSVHSSVLFTKGLDSTGLLKVQYTQFSSVYTCYTGFTV